ncbi:sugar ABC transporter ATP-binding protein [Candidatus Sumerlaeota bacterium]|nr:sugar ABC transporter ATP-binding protein [Candidatus Sumerlaeota bacterium]
MLLEMRGIRKAFGSTVALDGVDFAVRRGEVHGLIGENGAGKSTLMKALSGALSADTGEMFLDGQPYKPSHSAAARRLGVAMIYQELTLAPHLTVEDNIALGLEKSPFSLLHRSRLRPRICEIFSVLRRPDIQPTRRVGDLSVGAQQMVEIARALFADAKIIVMDEPTSSLSHHDTEALFDGIGRLKQSGVAIVYISHFLEEIQRVADRFTVLRDGRTAGQGLVAETSLGQIVEMMVGRTLTEMFPRTPHTIGDSVLELTDVWGTTLPRGVSLKLRRGEILGIAGLVGAGRTEMLRAVYALDPVRRGQIRIVTVSGPALRARRPSERLKQGVGMLSENRKEEGLAVRMSIADNLTLANLRDFARAGWISPRRQLETARRWIAQVDIRARDPSQPVQTLSGGNQQKIALARLLQQGVDVLLLDEPTRGIDVASKAQIYGLIGQLAAQGKAILFVSSYLPELLGICDTLAVMHRGRLSEIRPAGQWSEQAIMAWATTESDEMAVVQGAEVAG